MDEILGVPPLVYIGLAVAGIIVSMVARRAEPGSAARRRYTIAGVVLFILLLLIGLADVLPWYLKRLGG